MGRTQGGDDRAGTGQQPDYGGGRGGAPDGVPDHEHVPAGVRGLHAGAGAVLEPAVYVRVSLREEASGPILVIRSTSGFRKERVTNRHAVLSLLSAAFFSDLKLHRQADPALVIYFFHFYLNHISDFHDIRDLINALV